MKSPYALDRSPPLTAGELGELRGKSIFVDGVFKGDYSLAIVNRFLVRSLIRAGLKVSCFSPESDWSTDASLNEMSDVRSRMLDAYPSNMAFDIHLRNTWPPETADMVGKVNGYVCFAWEEIEMPTYLVERFSRDLDILLVTSNFVRDACIHSGVTTNIEVVGNGCDHILNIPIAKQSPVPLHDRRRIMHVSTCFPRKGADLLVRAFAEAFTTDDKVELIIKTTPNPHNQIISQITDVKKLFPNCPPIEVIDRSLGTSELVALYRTADLLVAPTRGEGFGLPLAEALLWNIPVAATAYSGQIDFCNAHTSYLIDYRLVPSQAHVSGAFSVWAEPLISSISQQIKIALDDGSDAKKRTATGRDLIKKYFTWENVAERVMKALSRLPFQTARTQPENDWTFDLISTWKQTCGIATYSEHLTATETLAPKLKTIFSRDAIPSEVAQGRVHVTDGHAVEHRVWNYEVSGIDALAREILNGKSDVLWFQHHPGHFSKADMEKLCVAASASAYKAKVVTLHNVNEIKYNHGLDWVKTFDVAFVHTSNDAAILSAAGHRNPVVIPHGILTYSRKYDTNPHRPFTIGTFGFLTKHKNIEVLIDGVSRARSFLPSLCLKLVTCATASEESRLVRARTETMINYLHLGDSVSACFDFLDEDEIAKQLSECDLLIFIYGPSNESATGAARMALMMDTPLLCSRSGALTDIHPMAHVLKEIKPDTIAEAILCLSANRKFLSQYDDKRRQFASAFSYERVSLRYAAHIEAILGKRS
jgi:glycosyltransferase involved in cell wall biosynthesis